MVNIFRINVEGAVFFGQSSENILSTRMYVQVRYKLANYWTRIYLCLNCVNPAAAVVSKFRCVYWYSVCFVAYYDNFRRTPCTWYLYKTRKQQLAVRFGEIEEDFVETRLC